MFGGVAALLARRLGIDPLWLRIAFVIFAFIGGVGLVVYGGCWLALVYGADPANRWARAAGAIVLLLGVPLLLTDALRFLDGPLAVVALLLGLAVALWKRSPASPPPNAPGEPATPPPPPPAAAAAAAGQAAAGSVPPPARRRAGPPSVLGRATLGAAVLVAAVGALIDGANGGRLHPEQWLGAAAVVCGLGLLVGSVAGRAWWLALPAAAFALTGFLAGESARLGIEPTHLVGDLSVTVERGDAGGWLRREHLVMGTIDVWVDGAPRRPVTLDARAAIGEVRVAVARGVAVEVRAEAQHGEVLLREVERPDGTLRLGPAGAADVVVIARVGVGDVRIRELDEPVPAEPSGADAPGAERIGGQHVAEGVLLTPRGHVVLADGEAVIDADDEVLVGESWQLGDGISAIPTSYGEFRLLRGSLLLTPDGDLLDLAALRAELSPAAGEAPATTTVPAPPTTSMPSAPTTSVGS